MVSDLDKIARMLSTRRRETVSDAGRPRAAVLIGLYGPGPDYRLLYTVRTHKVEHHKGEISFPGGAWDPQDSSVVETALRESFEEIGLRGEHVRVLGKLDDMLTISNFAVTPVLGRVERHPYSFRIHQEEVDTLLEVPLSHLLDPSHHVPHPRTGQMRPVPAYQFGPHVIFGATAMMTARLLALLQGQ